jgi:hypothetical protein
VEVDALILLPFIMTLFLIPGSDYDREGRRYRSKQQSALLPLPSTHKLCKKEGYIQMIQGKAYDYVGVKNLV